MPTQVSVTRCWNKKPIFSKVTQKVAKAVSTIALDSFRNPNIWATVETKFQSGLTVTNSLKVEDAGKEPFWPTIKINIKVF